MFCIVSVYFVLLIEGKERVSRLLSRQLRAFDMLAIMWLDNGQGSMENHWLKAKQTSKIRNGPLNQKLQFWWTACVGASQPRRGKLLVCKPVCFYALTTWNTTIPKTPESYTRQLNLCGLQDWNERGQKEGCSSSIAANWHAAVKSNVNPASLNRDP